MYFYSVRNKQTKEKTIKSKSSSLEKLSLGRAHLGHTLDILGHSCQVSVDRDEPQLRVCLAAHEDIDRLLPVARDKLTWFRPQSLRPPRACSSRLHASPPWSRRPSRGEGGERREE